MVEQPLLQQWRERLAEMEFQLSQPSQLAWYYEIQARILKYLISRYEHAPVLKNSCSGQSDQQQGLVSPYFKIVSPVHREVRNQAQIRTILDRIADVSGQHPNRCSSGWSIFE
ncbi:hypothetical protein OAF98_05900 [Planctomicrobium sp.]|jgi:hypothetical protein|nr:hypothetical protein [bacterium]MDB4744002.1 hypothetical protein [Planctomicrobium sp.]MDB4793133.1 hypothetical protein [bacterium]MDB4802887.1 hypothetical protein [bacterium]